MFKTKRRPEQHKMTCDYCIRLPATTYVSPIGMAFRPFIDYMIHDKRWYVKQVRPGVWKHCCGDCVKRILESTDIRLIKEITKTNDDGSPQRDMNNNAHRVRGFMKYRDAQ